VTLLAFPTKEFGGQEYSTDAEVAKFAGANGPSNLVLLQLGTLAEKVGWFKESKPTWNFNGKWVSDKDGNRRLIDSAKDVIPALEALL